MDDTGTEHVLHSVLCVVFLMIAVVVGSGFFMFSTNECEKQKQARRKPTQILCPLSESRQHTSVFVGVCALCQHTGFSECKARTMEAIRNTLATLPMFEGGFWRSSSEKMRLRGSKKWKSDLRMLPQNTLFETSLGISMCVHATRHALATSSLSQSSHTHSHHTRTINA